MASTLNNNFVDSLLCGVLLDKDLAEICLVHLKENYIVSDDYRRIWQEIVLFRKRRLKYPSIPFLIQKFDNDKKNDNDAIIDILSSFRQKIKSDIDVDSLMEGLEVFIKENKFVESYNAMGNFWTQGKKDKAFKVFLATSEQISKFSLKAQSLERLFTDFEKRFYKRQIEIEENKKVLVPYGLPFLNRDTHGGALTGETELWIGDSGTGKSRCLISRGVHAAQVGLNVLHIAAEGTKKQLEDNYDANFTRVPHAELRFQNIPSTRFKASLSRAKKYLKDMGGEVYLHAVEQFDTINMIEIRNVALDLMRSGVDISLILIDYLGIIPAGDGESYDFESGQQKEQKKVARMMKNLAVETNSLVSTVVQTHSISPELSNNPLFYITRWNIGEFKRIIEPFSYIYTINQTNEEKKENRGRLFVDKYRDHKSGFLYPFISDLKHSRFFNLEKTIELIEEVEEMGGERGISVELLKELAK